MKTEQSMHSHEGKGIERKEMGKLSKKDLRQNPRPESSSRGGIKHSNRGK